MERQLDLFADGPTTTVAPQRPHANASVTRQAAGVAIRPTAAKLRTRVLQFIRSQGTLGATDAEIQEQLEMRGDTERPRRRELQKAGLIVDSGEARTTPSGRAAVVWVGTPAAGTVNQTPGPEVEPPF